MNVGTAPAETALTMRDRMAMYNGNALKMGLFGANCSSAPLRHHACPKRWTGNWEDNLALAQMCDARGIEFMPLVGRWKGLWRRHRLHGHDPRDHHLGAPGLLANTKRLIAFGTGARRCSIR